MTRLTALLLLALLSLSPAMAAQCLEGCAQAELASAAQPATSCEHRDVREPASVFAAAACPGAPASFVRVETRSFESALIPLIAVTQIAAAPVRLPIPERYLGHQPPTASSPAPLRI